MNIGLHFAAACGLAAFFVASAPASALTFTYNLTGDTNAGYSDPAWPGWTYVDLTPAPAPGYTLNVGDTVQATISLNNAVTLNQLEIFLQETNEEPRMWFDTTLSYFSGGLPVTAPSSDWFQSTNAHGGLGFAAYFADESGTFSFDRIIVNAVVTAMTLPGGGSPTSINLTEYTPYFGFYNPAVATTPIPGGLLLMVTALGGLGILARRKRAAA
jgi:hypothetical protein